MPKGVKDADVLVTIAQNELKDLAIIDGGESVVSHGRLKQFLKKHLTREDKWKIKFGS